MTAIVDTGATASIMPLDVAEALASRGRLLGEPKTDSRRSFRTASGDVVTSSSTATFLLPEPFGPTAFHVMEPGGSGKTPTLLGQDALQDTMINVSSGELTKAGSKVKLRRTQGGHLILELLSVAELQSLKQEKEENPGGNSESSEGGKRVRFQEF